MASGLTNLAPITVCGRDLPTSRLFYNIPMLHLILEEVVKDWLRAVDPYQGQVDDADNDSARTFAVASGFMELRPQFLKCLFSYVFLFVAADQAYAHFYRELNHANNVSGLRLPHDKPPKATPFIEKICRIRDISIAHFPAEPSKQVSALDAYAAMDWMAMSMPVDDIEKLAFGASRFGGTDDSGQRVESQDREVPGVRIAHSQHCLPYLNQYDKMCCDYLQALQAALSCKGGVP